MILLYAGRRPGPDFPEANEAFVARQIEHVISGLRPRLVIGSAAAGADLLVVDAAVAQEVPAEVLVAGDTDRFREGSVDDKGESWTRRYRALLDGADVEVTNVDPCEDPEETYRRITGLIAARPDALVEPDEEVVVLVVATARAEGVDHTEELAADGRARGRLVLRIDPARVEAESPHAFVAMPFGIKPYPDRGWRRYDADLTYHRIMLPALVDAGLQPMRADTDALLEIIDHTMLRVINGAAVMLVDLAMLNANVMWELGVRHAWRRSGTILMAPEWVRAPFDVSRVPVTTYARGARTIAEREIVATIAKLQNLLAAVEERRVDSPVFANVNDLSDVVIPDPPSDGRDDSAGDLLVLATSAADLGDVAALGALAGRIRDQGDLPAIAKTALLEQIGLALIGLDRHDLAVDVLGPLAGDDVGFERRRLQEQYAHALIRSSDDAAEETRLVDAQRRLQAVLKRHGPTGETLGLLGSAFKRRVEAALSAGAAPDAGHVELAIDAYRRGLQEDPGDSYPGVNAVALLRLRAQRFGGPEDDAREALELLPVVRFAVTRNAASADDPWATLTLAECALHAHFLTAAPGELAEAERLYAAGSVSVDPQQRRSAGRQLRLMRNAGDPADVVATLVDLFG